MNMRIDDIHIDGFGRFDQFSLEDLNPGLTIFSGANEAGKSTLLAFIRSILFGFPSSRSGTNRYPPLQGGKHGGRLVMNTDSDDRCVIERHDERGGGVKVALPDGSTGGADELSKLLGYTDQNIFENVYAFGLSELQKFESLNNASIRDKLYSVGAGLGSVSISDVQKHLKNQHESLYRKQGRKPPINKLFSDMNQLNLTINDLEKDQSKYDLLHMEFKAKSELIEQLKKDHLGIDKNLNHVNGIISIWNDWINFQDSKADIEDLPILEKFPENGSNDLERILEKIEDSTNSISLINEDTNKNELEISSIVLNEELLKQRDTILDLGNGIEKYRSEFESLPLQKSRLMDDQSVFHDMLSELGPQWDEEKLNNFDRSIPARETVIQKRKAIEDIEKEITEIQHESMQVNRDIEKIDVEIEENQEKLQQYNIQTNNDEVEQGLDAIRNLRSKYRVLDEKQLDLKDIKKDEEWISKIQPTPTPITTEQKTPMWPAGLIVIAGVIGLIYGYFIDELLFGITMFIVLIVTAGVYFVSIRKNRSDINEASDNIYISKDNVQQDKESSSLKQQLVDDIESLSKEMLTYAQLVGFNETPQPDMLDQKYDSLKNDGVKLSAVSDIKTTLKKLLKGKEKLDGQLNEINGRKADEDVKLSSMKQEWKNWLSEYDLDTNLSPDSILEIFSTIKTCYEKQKMIKILESQIRSNEESIQGYEDKICSVLDQCDRSRSGISLDSELEKLRDDVEVEQKNHEHLKQLGIDKGKLLVELESANAKYSNLEKQLLDLLKSGSSKDESEFRKNAAIWDEQVRLKNEIKNSNNQIRRISGDGESYDKFISELQVADIDKLKRDMQELNDNLETLDSDISDNTDERGRIREQLEQLEYRAEGSILRMEKEVLKEDLHKKSRDWASYVLAQEVLKKAIEVYEKESQPEVIKEAQSFFSNITDGRYKRIYSPVSSSDIFVEDRDGSQKQTFQLSKGTAEQLYLALRFGFIKELGKHSERLPIIFDDILVNFDPARSVNAGNTIKQLASTNQILYFTCHPSTANILKEIVPDARVIDLDGFCD